MLTQKADQGEIRKLWRMFSSYAPIHEFRDLKKLVVDEYTPNDEFEICQADIKSMRDQLKIKANLVQVDEDIKLMAESIQRQLGKFIKNSQFDKHVEESSLEMEQLLKKISLATSDLKNMKTYSDYFSNKMKTKVEFSDLKVETDKIRDHFTKFWSYEHLQDLKNQVEPMVELVGVRLNQYQMNHEKNSAIIQRFDEVLLEKASKFNLEEIRQEMKQYISIEGFDIFKKDLNSKHDDIQNEIKHTSGLISKMKDQVCEEFKDNIDHTILDFK